LFIAETIVIVEVSTGHDALGYVRAIPIPAIVERAKMFFTPSLYFSIRMRCAALVRKSIFTSLASRETFVIVPDPPGAT
jgi:hypothetical protein